MKNAPRECFTRRGSRIDSGEETASSVARKRERIVSRSSKVNDDLSRVLARERGKKREMESVHAGSERSVASAVAGPRRADYKSSRGIQFQPVTVVEKSGRYSRSRRNFLSIRDRFPWRALVLEDAFSLRPLFSSSSSSCTLACTSSYPPCFSLVCTVNRSNSSRP